MFTPLEDRVLVKPLDPPTETVSGIVLPDMAQEKPMRGLIVAAGPGLRHRDTGELIPLDVANGDTVVYSRYAGQEIRVDDETLLVLRQTDLLGVEDDE